VPTEKPGHLLVAEAPPKTSAIENELPTYRAIDNRAVASVICGVLASFSFAYMGFLVLAVVAVVLGLMANVAIKRNPDILTGRRIANVGIALGLIFGLTVATFTSIQSFILTREATKFAMFYGKVLNEGSYGDALLYRQPPATRENKIGADAEKELNGMKARDKAMVDMKLTSFNNLRKALSSKDAHLHFLSIESQGVDENRVGQVTYYAGALYEVDAPNAAGPSAGHQYAMIVMKGETKGRHYEWWVEEVAYPYAPKSYKVAPKPIDDGHGHAPGAH
jgi:hypothetical protein